MANPRDLNVRINGDPTKFENAVIRAEARLTQMQRTQERVDREFRNSQSAHGAALRENAAREEALAAAARQAQEQRAAAWQTAGRTIVATSAAIAAGLTLTAKAAMDWETAWTGVLKTVDGSSSQLADLEDGLRDLSREVSSTHSEIAAVAEVAGQLGIATDNVLGFTKVMIDLGQTTNLSSAEAASSFARFMGVMGTAQGDVDRLGSTVVELGNNFATTEREIITMAQRLSAAGKVVGLSESDVLALATAMSSVGIEAEAGGSAMSRVMVKIAKAVDTGSDKLETFATVAGMSSAEFSATWAGDPIAAMLAVVGGLGDMSAAGSGAFQALEDLGMKDIRVSNAMLSLAANVDQVTRAQEMANEAWKDNTALVAEAEKRYGTSAAKIQMAKNSLNDTAITIGETFLPMIAGAADGFSDLAEWVGNLPAPLLHAAAGVGAVAAAFGLVAGSLILVVPQVRATVAAFGLLNAAHPRAATGLRRLGVALGVAGAAFAAYSIISAATARDVSVSMEEMFATLKKLPASADPVKDVLGDLIPEGTLPRGEAFADLLKRMAAPSTWQSIEGNLSGAAISISRLWGNDEAKISETTQRMKEYGESLATLAGDNLPAAVDAFSALVDSAGGSNDAAVNLLATMPALREELIGISTSAGLATDDAELLKLILGEIEPPEKDVETGLYGVDAAAKKAETAVAEAAEELDKWRKKVTEASLTFIDPTDAYAAVIEANTAFAESTAEATKSAEDSWEDYYDGLTVTAADYIAELERQVADQATYNANMLDLATRVSGSYLVYLDGLGKDAAPLIADLAAMLPEELAAVDDLYNVGQAQAQDYAWGMESIKAELGVDTSTAEGAVDQLSANIAAQGLGVSMWPLDVDTAPALGTAGWLQSELNGTGTSLPDWLVDANTDAAITSANTAATMINGKSATVTVNANTDPATLITDTWLSLFGRKTVTVGVTAATGPTGSSQGAYQKHATGGAIRGPGTGTSDDVLIWASNDEHMFTASDVQKLGGQSEVYRLRAAIQAGTLPAFAVGGALGDAWAHRQRALSDWQGAHQYAVSALPHGEGTQIYRDAKAAEDRAKQVFDDATARVARLQDEQRTASTEARRGDVVSGATSSLSGAYSLVDRLAGMSRDSDYDAASRAELAAAATVGDNAFRSLYAQADKIEAKLADARDRLAELAAISTQVSSTLRNGFSITDAVTPKQNTNAKGDIWYTAATGSSVLASAKQYAASVKAFAGKIDALRKKGFSGVILQEIASKGVTEGGAAADALLTMSTAETTQLNAAYKDIETWSNKAGDYVTQGFYNGGVAAAQGLIKGLESQQHAVEKQITDLAAGLEAALKRALGIASPSKVTTRLGVHTAEGVIVGVRSQLPSVKTAAADLALAAVPSRASMLPVPSGTYMSVQSAPTSTSVAVSVDRSALVGALDGMSLTLTVDGQPIAAVVNATLDGRASSVKYAGSGAGF